MESPNIQRVEKGAPITADAMNAIIDRVNDREDAPFAPPRRARAVGEFWITNATGADIPAFSVVGLVGFARTYATLEAAFSDVANDSIVFRTTGADLPTPNNFAFTLERIAAGRAGRATFCGGSLIFGVVAGSGSVASDARFFTPSSGANVGKFVVDANGSFGNVGFDATTRFVAVSPALSSIQYFAGDGLSLVGTTFHANPFFKWGYWSGASYTNTGETRCNGAGKLCFSEQFESSPRQDDVTGAEVRIKTTTVGAVIDGSATLQYGDNYANYLSDVTLHKDPNSGAYWLEKEYGSYRIPSGVALSFTRENATKIG